MGLIRNENIVNILETTLNHVDPRLVGHGKRVAYMLYTILKDKYERRQMRDICLLCLLHDVGAYETDEIENFCDFEMKWVWEHSVYGYLFLKYFSPLKHWAPAVLYHHAAYDKTKYVHTEVRHIAQLISLASLADLFNNSDCVEGDLVTYLEKVRDKFYHSDYINIFMSSDINLDSYPEDMESDESFHDLFYNTPMNVAEVESYIRMIISSIDFRSSQTVIHTRVVSAVAVHLARLIDMTEVETDKIKTGAQLHDIGKISTPLHILEGNTRLSDEEMKIMRDHVVMSAEILNGNVDEEVKNIAVNHHEKIDGTGYPNGLKNLPVSDRLMAVADVFSALCAKRSYKKAYSKEKTIGILENMANNKHLDHNLVDLSIHHFDELMAITNHESNLAIEEYEAIRNEYKKIIQDIK